MKVNLEFEVEPFSVPHNVEFTAKTGEDVQLSIRMLNAEQLEQLCAQFRRETFNNAGIPLPPPMPEDGSVVRVRSYEAEREKFLAASEGIAKNRLTGMWHGWCLKCGLTDAKTLNTRDNTVRP